MKIHCMAITSWLLDVTSKRADVIWEVPFLKRFYEDRVMAMKRYLEGEQPSPMYTRVGYRQAWFFNWNLRDERSGFDGLKELSTAPAHQARQTDDTIETAIVNIRRCREKRARDETKDAFMGAVAIRQALQDLGDKPPSVRTGHTI